MFQKSRKIKENTGMSYIELIVVLSIFSVLSSVVMFNYGDFQAKVDLKNLASDIALKVVEAQKSSLSGLLPVQIPAILQWKPSYGIYFFNPTTNNKNFIYFVDLDNDKQYYDGANCVGECVKKIVIAKTNYISRLDVFYEGDTSPHPISDLTLTFARPDSGATIKSTSPFTFAVSYVQITISSPKLFTVAIKVYPSGRIQVN